MGHCDDISTSPVGTLEDGLAAQLQMAEDTIPIEALQMIEHGIYVIGGSVVVSGLGAGVGATTRAGGPAGAVIAIL